MLLDQLDLRVPLDLLDLQDHKDQLVPKDQLVLKVFKVFRETKVQLDPQVLRVLLVPLALQEHLVLTLL